MPTLNEDEKDRFRQEINLAEKVVEEEKEVWDKCREFYRGKQNPEADNPDERMSVNLIFSNVVSDLPSLTFSNPTFNSRPERTLGMSKEQLITQQVRSMLAESLLNYYAEREDYKKHQDLGILDAKLSLGMWKVFFRIEEEDSEEGNGDTPQNEQVSLQDGMIETDEDGRPETESESDVIRQDFMLRRVRPEYFLIDPRAGNFIESASWVGEKIPMRTEKARDIFGESIQSDTTFNPFDGESDDVGKDTAQLVGVNADENVSESLNQTMVYEIWDRENSRRFYMVNGDFYDVTETPEEYQSLDGNPYVPLKFHEIPNRFYPIPDVFFQIPINESYNNARSSLNSFREMMVPKMVANMSAFEDQDEVDKLQSNKTGEVLKAKNNAEGAIAPIQLPSLPSGIFETMSTDMRDLQLVSGVTDEQLGQPDPGVTATQSQISNQLAQSKGQWKKKKVETSFRRIGEKLLKLIQHRMVTGGVIEITGPLGKKWVDYSPDDIKGQFDISVEFGSTEAVDEQTERAQLMEAIQLLSSVPGLIQQFHLPRLAEQIVEHIPGISNSSLMVGQSRRSEILTVSDIVKRMKNDEMTEGVVPNQSPMEQGSGGSGGPQTGSGQNRQNNANVTGAGGASGAPGGQQRGQAMNEFLQQQLQQAAGGQQS